jgi:hypothetical protein
MKYKKRTPLKSHGVVSWEKQHGIDPKSLSEYADEIKQIHDKR